MTSKENMISHSSVKYGFMKKDPVNGGLGGPEVETCTNGPGSVKLPQGSCSGNVPKF